MSPWDSPHASRNSSACEKAQIPSGTIADRVRHDVRAVSDGRRILIFSGGAAETDDKLLRQVRGVQEGGGFGSVIGRHSFTRKKEDALQARWDHH